MNTEKVFEREIIEADVVVAGGGGAGLAAAASAAENGAKVVLLEKRKMLGGNSAMANAIFGVETLPQLRDKIDARADEMFKNAMRFSNWTVDPKLVRTFIDKSTEAINWLQEMGLDFYLLAMWPNQVPRVSHIPRREEGTGSGGDKILEKMAEHAKKHGAEIMCQVAAKEIIMDDNGRAAGILADKRDGGELEVRAKNVILATGGYGGNKEMLKKYCRYYNENIQLLGAPNMGDGLTMANKVGAANEGLGTIHSEAAGYVPGGGDVMMAVVQEPYVIMVNKRGERFLDEAYTTVWNVFEASQAIMRQPESACYAIIDAEMRRRLEEETFIHGWRHYRFGTKCPNLDEILRKTQDKGSVFISESWDEIAGWIGAKPEALKATVDNYNKMCDNKHDNEMAKESRYMIPLRKPPYYVILNYPVMLSTIGGIKINQRAEVLDTNDEWIPGVYAAGIDTGGWANEHYNSHLAGHAFGFSIYSGRIAGENAARGVS